MPVIQSAKKALRVSRRKNIVNNKVRSRMKTAVSSFLSSPSAEALSEAFRRIDRAVKMNLMHKNTAARRKSALSAKMGAK